MKQEVIDFGCNITGINVKSINQQGLEALQAALYRNRLIVIKDQDLNEQDYVDFANRFGSPIAYLQSHYNHPDFPLIFVSSNIKQNGKQIGVARTGGYWHSDTAFEESPKPITMLLPKVLPKLTTRSTRFIDMSAVYSAIPAEILEQIEGEQFIHSGRWKYKVRQEDIGLDMSEILQFIDHYQPPVHHPAVMQHPVTKEKIIYASRGFTIGITNKSYEQSNKILKEIFDFAETKKFIKEVIWSPGDLIIWDNRFLVHNSGREHAASDDIHDVINNEEDTMMYRITLLDSYPLCASQQKEAEMAFS